MSVSNAAAGAGDTAMAASGIPAGNPATAATGTARVKRGMADMLKGGVIMDVVKVYQAVVPAAGKVEVVL